MSNKKYFCFSQQSFKSVNRSSSSHFDYKQFITDIDNKQLKEYSKYDHFKIFESEADCANFASKFASDYKQYVLQKEIDLKQLFLDTFSKEFCNYVFVKNKNVTNQNYEYFVKNIKISDYLLKDKLFSKESLDLKLKHSKSLYDINWLISNKTIFDIKNNEICSIELKFEIAPIEKSSNNE